MTQIHYATAKRTGPGSGIGDLKTPQDFNRAADIAIAAGDRSMLLRVIACRDKMFPPTGQRSAAGDLARIDAVLRQIKQDEARDAKRLSSPLAREFAALSARCRRIVSRYDQARIAAALRVGGDDRGQVVLPYNRAGSNGDWYPCDDEEREDEEFERGTTRTTRSTWCPDPDDPDDVIYLED